MTQPPADGGGFPAYLAAAITDAGFPTPTRFAREAKIEPNVVFSWLRGERRPTLRLIERFAPHLGLPISEIVAMVYPGQDGPPPRRPLHRLAREVDRLLDDSSPLSSEAKQRLVIVVEEAIAAARAGARGKRAS